ncbi:MAG: choice-of-anchor J domain-containing protein [Flavobacteriaceae bacterium]|nr:choice-of-anchor J domain-containing protein [Flavobacteriaceae bacterium]
MSKIYLFLAILTATTALHAQSIVYFEDFENPENRDSWTLAELDGDGELWEFLDAQLNSVDSFQGYFAVSFSWYFEAFTPDNLLISPAIQLPESNDLTLEFKAAAGDEELFDEHYAVYIIPAGTNFTGNEIPVFEETLDAGYQDAAKEISIDISSFTGQEIQVVFRHYECEDIFYFGIDDVVITDHENLSISEIETHKIKLYPNPATDFIQIATDETFIKAQIIDVNGKLIQESTTKSISVSHLQKGIYFVKIFTENKIVSEKFIKR